MPDTGRRHGLKAGPCLSLITWLMQRRGTGTGSMPLPAPFLRKSVVQRGSSRLGAVAMHSRALLTGLRCSVPSFLVLHTCTDIAGDTGGGQRPKSPEELGLEKLRSRGGREEAKEGGKRKKHWEPCVYRMSSTTSFLLCTITGCLLVRQVPQGEACLRTTSGEQQA